MSTLGRVVHRSSRSVALLSPPTFRKYPRVVLRDCAKKWISLSRLILLSFQLHGSRGNLVAQHIDANRANCCLYNLRWEKGSTLARQRLANGGGRRKSGRVVLHHIMVGDVAQVR